jgi:hypothetical protein
MSKRNLWLPALALVLATTLGGPALAGARDHGGSNEALCAAGARTITILESIQERLDGWPRGPFRRFLRRSGLLHGLERATWRAARRQANRCVALNQVQVLGTHNSYHIEPPQQLIDIYTAFDPQAVEWQYTHRPLDEQFAELGIRQIELDVFADPDGGLYASPVGLQVLTEDPDAFIPELEAPGIKVLHVQELDWNTRCQTLVECLDILKAWSDGRPDHLPVFVLIEAKDDTIPDPLMLDFTVPIPWGPDEFDDLDAVIRSVFPPERLITPDDVRGDHATLEDAVRAGGWPRLREARGRVLFGLDNGGAKRDAYRDGRTNLEGRVLFVDGTPGEPDAAFVKVNGPVGNEDLIRDLVAEGYIVRTRADAGTIQSRENDTTQRESALGSGAQFVSSDYPEPDLRFSEYRVEIPGGQTARCNPVNAPPGCRDGALEP